MTTPTDLHYALAVLASPEGVVPPVEDGPSLVLVVVATVGWLVAAAFTLL